MATPDLGGRARDAGPNADFAGIGRHPVRDRHRARLSARSGRAPAGALRPLSPCRLRADPGRIHRRARAHPRDRRADPRRTAHRFHRQTAGLCHAAAGARGPAGLDVDRQIRRALARLVWARDIGLRGADPKVDRRFCRSWRAMAAERRQLARLRRRGDPQFLLTARRYAGRRLLYSCRLGENDRHARLLVAARPSRVASCAGRRDQRGAGRIRPWPVAGRALSRRLVRRRPDGDRSGFRLPDRRHRRRAELRALCRLLDRSGPLARRRARAGLAEAQPLLPGARARRRRTVPGGLCHIAQAGWGVDRPAPGMADVRAVRGRRTVRLHRPLDRRAHGGGARGTRPPSAAPLPRESALSGQRRAGKLVVTPSSRQLTLDWPHETSWARDDFLIAPENAGALRTLDAWPRWPSPVQLLVGPEGSGKSHLGAIWARLAQASAVSGERLADVELLELARGPALLIEDADQIGPEEAALFHLLNLAREHGASALITARLAPDLWGLKTPDLLSRLRLAPMLTLGEPSPELSRAVLVKLFSDRQLIVDASVIAYIALRIERSLDAARAIVAALDREALARGQRVTRAMVAELLSDAAEQ